MRGPKDHKNFMNNKHLYLIRRVNNYYYVEDHNYNAFKTLLNKCPNITSIDMSGNHHGDGEFLTVNIGESNRDKNNGVFRLIIENCNNLSEINFLDVINDSNLEDFHRKFGPKIKYLPSFGRLNDLNRFPNIEKVVIDKNQNSIIPQLNLAKLKQLELSPVYNQDLILQTFIDTFPTLTHLNLFRPGEDEDTIYEPLKNISNLKHLIHFYFHIRFRVAVNGSGIKNKEFCGLLKQMANNCQNLKSIDCRFYIDQSSDVKQLLTQLKSFLALKRLNLRFCSVDYGENSVYIDVNQLFSFASFKGFSNITHLSLFLKGRLTLKESLIKDIDINLPNLQYFKIDYPFDTTAEGVTQMADILSRLSKLQTIQLYFKSGVDFKPIEEQITKKCRKIEIKTFY